MTLAGKVATVTGAGSGIGKAIAETLTARGATVIVSDLTLDAAATVADRLDGAHAVACDVTREEQVAALVAGAVERHGRLDIAVANAGVAPRPAPVTALDLEDWRRVIAVNLDGTMLMIKHAGEALARASRGSIIATSSITAYGAVPMWTAYCASKAAVLALVRNAAIELRPVAVRVNAVCPGFANTPMMDANATELGAALGIDNIPGVIAMTQGRLLEPTEIAQLVAWLASDQAAFCTGAAYTIDGGLTATI